MESASISDPAPADAQRDTELLAMVSEAVRNRRALLAYQPVVRAPDPGSVAFHEGLIRILDPMGRIVPARDFMPLAESTELGRAIDRLALDLGCSTLSRVPGLRLSINLSAGSIGSGAWLATLDRWLHADDSIGPRLILEFTEGTAMTDAQLAAGFMNRLRLRGISFALDDFGSGCTALRYFRDFRFEILKIDGQFIRGIAEDPDNRCLVRAMLSIGRHFDMLCVAEMVETEADAEVLTALGADCLQGYLFGAPTIAPLWLPRGRPARLTA